MDDDERIKLLDACKQSSNKQLYVIVVLALSTGMRKGEILNLRRRDVFLNTINGVRVNRYSPFHDIYKISDLLL